jgi:ribonuclease D
MPDDPLADVPLVLVESTRALEDLASRVRGAAVVALDTEANSLYAYRERTCVVQLTVNGDHAIVDAVAVPDLGPLRDALDTPDPEVVFHGGDYDIAVLSRDHGFVFHRIFDTMVAATILAEPKVGLADLVRDTYGVQLDKRFQKADWGRRPLTQEQLQYLYRDTAYLPGLRATLRDRLVEADLLEEAEIEFRYLAGRTGVPHELDPEGWRRIKGASKLDARGRAVMAGLHLWREAEAERRDVPPFKVLGPREMLAIAQNPPKNARHPSQIRGLDRRRRVPRSVLDAIREGLDAARDGRIPPARLHAPPSKTERVSHKRAKRVEDALRAWRKEEAATREVVNLVVLPNRALSWLAGRQPERVEDLAACADIGPKRTARYGRVILEIVRDACG